MRKGAKGATGGTTRSRGPMWTNIALPAAGTGLRPSSMPRCLNSPPWTQSQRVHVPALSAMEVSEPNSVRAPMCMPSAKAQLNRFHCRFQACQRRRNEQNHSGTDNKSEDSEGRGNISVSSSSPISPSPIPNLQAAQKLCGRCRNFNRLVFFSSWYFELG